MNRGSNAKGFGFILYSKALRTLLPENLLFCTIFRQGRSSVLNSHNTRKTPMSRSVKSIWKVIGTIYLPVNLPIQTGSTHCLITHMGIDTRTKQAQTNLKMTVPTLLTQIAATLQVQVQVIKNRIKTVWKTQVKIEDIRRFSINSHELWYYDWKW